MQRKERKISQNERLDVEIKQTVEQLPSSVSLGDKSSLGNDDFVDVTHVLLQMGLLAERPRAQVAFERLGARVDHRVDGQVAGRGEHFAAHVATVAFFAVAFRIAARTAAAAAVVVIVVVVVGIFVGR